MFCGLRKNDGATALDEIRAGRKESHWMWYVFPQIEGLGQSSMAVHYAIADLDELDLDERARLRSELIASILTSAVSPSRRS